MKPGIRPICPSVIILRSTGPRDVNGKFFQPSFDPLKLNCCISIVGTYVMQVFIYDLLIDLAIETDQF